MRERVAEKGKACKRVGRVEADGRAFREHGSRAFGVSVFCSDKTVSLGRQAPLSAQPICMSAIKFCFGNRQKKQGGTAFDERPSQMCERRFLFL